MKSGSIIGFGQVAKVRHLEAIKRNSQLTVSSVVNPLEQHRSSLAKLNIPEKKFEDVLEDSSIDFLAICLPPAFHFEYAKAALSANKHVLCEKPFVLNPSEGEELLELAKSKSLSLHVVENFWHGLAMTKIKKILKNSEIGEVKGFHGVQWSPDTRRKPIWHSEIPGGLFYDEAPHFFYLIKRIFGDMNIESNFSTGGDGFENLWNLTLMNKSYKGTITCWFGAPISEWHFIIVGSEGFILYDIFRDIHYLEKKELSRDYFTIGSRLVNFPIKFGIEFSKRIFSRITKGRNLFGHEGVYDAFLESMTNTPNYDSANRGIDVIRMLNQITSKNG